jgi:glucan biosynthesis protein C
LIILVIYVHSAVTYSGLGSWYYVENKSIDALSFVVLGFFQSWIQAYFMGTLFFIAGYFAVDSLNRKGKTRFIWDRFLRLGVPTILYILILNYLCFYLLGYAANYVDYLSKGLDNLQLLSWTGPMWFAFALLIFSIIYALAVKPGGVQTQPIKNITQIILILTLATFLTRIIQPIDSSIYNM